MRPPCVEACYKALYGQSRKVVGFDAMDIRPSPDQGAFTAYLNQSFGPVPSGSILQGQILRYGNMVLTMLTVPVSPECGANVAKIPDLEMECFQAERA